eukprot:GHVH01006706.1.p1 GENE.GHVH01006706.1~~GHVH01006706.1.p1  ORF type:complete len:478 (+),score=90.13 GHVH01006706.1:202-1635(+)
MSSKTSSKVSQAVEKLAHPSNPLVSHRAPVMSSQKLSQESQLQGSRRASTQETNHIRSHVVATNNGLHIADGITGVRQVSHNGPHLGTSSRRVEIVDGTSPRHTAKLSDATFAINVASRSDSVSDIAFPEGAVEIEQHYYKGDVLEEHYGEVDESTMKDMVIREVPIYKKEIDEVIKRERVVNRVVERVPKFNYIDTVVDVEHIVEVPVYREIPVKKTVVKQVPKQVREQRLIEKVRYVPFTQTVDVERIVEIPGEIIVQPRHVVRDECIVTDKHLDKEVPVVISQVVNPIMKDTKKKVRVPAKVLTPDLDTASVRVPKPVDLEFHQSEAKTTFHHLSLNDAEYNSAFFQLNAHLADDHRRALKANRHVKVDKETGFPVVREKNLKFYRLPESELSHIEGWAAVVGRSGSTTSSTSSISSSDLKQNGTGSHVSHHTKKSVSSTVSKSQHSKTQHHTRQPENIVGSTVVGHKYISAAN